DWNGSENGLTFLKEAEGALIPMASPATETLAQSAAAAIPDGRMITAPAAPIAQGVAQPWPVRPQRETS
ncbi:MAG: hypothetical protein ACRD5R_15775, partial [Candidatus Acidiferrales bacterium]